MSFDLERSTLIGSAAALAVVCFWSGWIVVSRLGVTNTLTVFDVAGLRFGVGSLVALPFIIKFRAWRGLTLKRTLVISIGSGVPYGLLTYFGFSLAPAAHGGVFLNGSLPLFTTIVAWLWLGQKSRPSQIVGLVIIMAGVVLVAYEGIVASGNGSTWAGDLIFLCAISMFAVFMVATREWNITPWQILFSATLLGGIFYVPIWLLWLDSALFAAPRSEILLQGIYQGLVPSFMGISLLGVAVGNIGAKAASVFFSAVPAVSALIGIPVLGEVPGTRAWIGMAVVTAGILLALGIFPPGGGQVRRA